MKVESGGVGRVYGSFDSRSPEDDSAVQAALEMAGAEGLAERFCMSSAMANANV